jgi:tetratricopeptide (TPR) repeat protein
MLSLAALWASWHRPSGKCAWLAAASLAYGLAVGARPSLLFGAVILFMPAAASLPDAVRDRSPGPWLRNFLAALLPISAVGVGLAAYNYGRFGDPLQFGHDYQLSGNNVYGTRSFAPQFFWDNFRLYFLEPLRWHAGFPFVWEPVTPELSPGHLPVEFSFGTLTNLPLLLAAALAPLAWRGERLGGARERILHGSFTVLLVLFLAGALPICCYAGATSRYLLDFTPVLALLALLGFLGLERTAGAAPDQTAARESPLASALRLAVRCALAYSVIVGALLAVALCTFYRGAEKGIGILAAGRIEEGIAHYERLCRINPDFRGRAELAIGSALIGRGRQDEGIAFLSSATRDEPGLAAAHFNLGMAYLGKGRDREAASSFGQAALLDPFDAEAEADLGVAVFREGRVNEAIEHEKAAIRIEPGLAQARDNLRAFEAYRR